MTTSKATIKDFMADSYEVKVVKAMTNENGKIYDGTARISWQYNTVEFDHTFFISDVAVIGGNRLMIINKGTLLVNPTWQDVKEVEAIGNANIKKAREEFRASREA